MTEFETQAKIQVSDDVLTEMEEQGFTYLHCTYFTTPIYHGGWWVNIYKSTYLVGDDGTELPMIHALNIPISPERHYLKKFGDSLTFTLVFPALPKTWKVFHCIEKCSGCDGLSAHNITKNNSGAYRVIMS